MLPSKCLWQDWGHQNFCTTAHPINYLNKTVAAGSADPAITFRSTHVGGAHFLLCDGTVRFIGENISGLTYNGLASRAGGEVLGEF